MLEEPFLSSPVMSEYGGTVPPSVVDNKKTRSIGRPPPPVLNVPSFKAAGSGDVVDYDLSFVENNSFILSPLQNNIPNSSGTPHTLAHPRHPSGAAPPTSSAYGFTTPATHHPTAHKNANREHLVTLNGKTPAVPKAVIPTLKEQERIIDEAKRENFSLKLKIFYLEERVKKMTPKYMEEALNENIELKIKNESLANEIATLKFIIKDNDNMIHRLQHEKAETSASFQSKYKEYDHQIGQLHARLAAFESELRDYERAKADLQTAQAENTKNVQRASEYASDLQESKSAFKDLLREYAHAKEEAKEIKRSSEELKSHIEALEKRIKEDEAHLKQRDNEIDSLKGAEEEKEAKIKELADKNEIIESDLSERELFIDTQWTEIRKKELALEALSAKLSESKDALSVLEDTAKQQDEKISLMLETLAQRDTTVSSLQEKVNALASSLNGSHSSRDQLEKELEQKDRLIQQHQAQGQKLEKEKGQLVDRIASLQTSVQENAQLLESIRKGKTEIEALLETHKNEKDALHVALSRSKALVATQEERTHALLDACDEKDQEMASIQASLHRLQAHNEALRDDVERKAQQMDVLEGDKANLDEQIGHLLLEKNKSMDLVSQLERDLQAKHSQGSMAEHEKRKLSESVERLNAQVKTHVEELERARTSLLASQDDNESLKGQLLKLDAGHQMSASQLALAQREIASLEKVKEEQSIKIVHFENKLESLYKDLNNTHSSFAHFEALNRDLGNENIYLKQQLSLSEIETGLLKGNVEKLTQQEEALAGKVRAKEAAMDKLKDKEQSLLQEIKDIEDELACSVQSQAALQKEVGTKSAAVHLLEERLAAFERTAREKDERIASLQESHAETQRALAEQKKNLASVQSSDSVAMVELAAAQDLASKANIKYTEAEKKVAALGEQVAALGESHSAELGRNADSLQRAEKALEQAKAELAAEKRRASEADEEKTRLSETVKRQQAAFDTRADALDQSIRALEETRQRLEGQLDVLNDEKQALRAQLSESAHLLAEKTTASVERQVLQEREREVASVREEMRMQLKRTEQEKAEIQAQIERLHEKAERDERRCAALLEERKQRAEAYETALQDKARETQRRQMQLADMKAHVEALEGQRQHDAGQHHRPAYRDREGLVALVEVLWTAAAHVDTKLRTLIDQLRRADVETGDEAAVEEALAVLRRVVRHLLRANHAYKGRVDEYASHFEELSAVVARWPSIHAATGAAEPLDEWSGLFSLSYQLPGLVSRLKAIQGLSVAQWSEMYRFLVGLQHCLRAHVDGTDIMSHSATPSAASLVAIIEALPRLQTSIMEAVRAIPDVRHALAAQRTRLVKLVDDKMAHVDGRLSRAVSASAALALNIGRLQTHAAQQDHVDSPAAALMVLQLQNALTVVKGENRELVRRFERMEKTHLEALVQSNHEKSKLLQETVEAHAKLDSVGKKLAALEEERARTAGSGGGERRSAAKDAVLIEENERLRRSLSAKTGELAESALRYHALDKNEGQLKKREMLIARALKRLEKINARKELMMQQLKSSAAAVVPAGRRGPMNKENNLNVANFGFAGGPGRSLLPPTNSNSIIIEPKGGRRLSSFNLDLENSEL